MAEENQDREAEKISDTELETEGARGEGGFVETMRDVAMLTRSTFPELIDYYDPEKDEIV